MRENNLWAENGNIQTQNEGKPNLKDPLNTTNLIKQKLEKKEWKGIGKLKIGKWSESEIDFIKNNYRKENIHDLSIILNRGVSAIAIKAKRLKINLPDWDQVELKLLSEKYPMLGKSKDILNIFPNKTYRQIRDKAKELNILIDPKYKLLGKMFYGWRIKELKDKDIWVCECDCGKTINSTLEALKNKENKICECYYNLLEVNKLNGKKHNWRGYGNISSSYLNRLNRSAKKRGLEFKINCKHLYDLLEAQDYKCALTGLDIYPRQGKVPGTASLDRINSKIGYVKDNIQWVHKDINKMKWEFTEDELLRYCKLILEYNKNK